MKIVGLLGPAGCGKSSVASYLSNKYGAKRYSFAQPLKEIVRLSFDLTESQVYGTQAQKEAVDPRYNVTPRWLLQRIGTQGVRAVLGPDFWWQHCLAQIERDAGEVAVIEDCRFENEVNGLLAKGASIWRIEAPGERDTQADQNHQSEAEWAQCAYTNQVKPAEYGLLELYDAADQAAFESGLAVTQKVLR